MKILIWMALGWLLGGLQTALPLGIACPELPGYARNIWDMEFYDGRLFVGCGNSSNLEPAPNAGPVGVVVYDEAVGWSREFTIDEEQISRFVMLGGVLTIPGHDGTEDWQFGNWYQRLGGAWTKRRNLPDGVHVFDLIEHQGMLFAALGSPRAMAVVTSRDGGETWAQQQLPVNASASDRDCSKGLPYPVGRVYNFFHVAGDLYANTEPTVTLICNNNGPRRAELLGNTVMRWNGSAFEISDLPLYGATAANRIERATLVGDHTVYIAGQSVNDHQWVPLGVFMVGPDLQPAPVALEGCGRPQDIQAFEGELYILCSQPVGDQWQITAWATRDLTAWRSIQLLSAATFARSFAVTSVGIYVALGSEPDSPASAQADTGEVWRIESVS